MVTGNSSSFASSRSSFEAARGDDSAADVEHRPLRGDHQPGGLL